LAVGAGLAWLLSPQPWLVDGAANEHLMQMSFDTLAHRAPTVFEYLRPLYRFFGLWILGLGLLVISYGATAYPQRQNATMNRLFLGILGFILVVQTVFLIVFIPDSPFLWLDLVASLLCALAVIVYPRVPSITPSKSSPSERP
jgi:hypothetical protein